MGWQKCPVCLASVPECNVCEGFGILDECTGRPPGLTPNGMCETAKKAAEPQEVAPDLKPEEIIKPMSVFEELTEDEIQYWSTPYFDELQEQKERQKKLRESDGE